MTSMDKQDRCHVRNRGRFLGCRLFPGVFLASWRGSSVGDLGLPATHCSEDPTLQPAAGSSIAQLLEERRLEANEKSSSMAC